MIHMLQCLCGPARHAIMAILYDDKIISPQDAMDGLRALVEMQVDNGMLNRRCEICDKKITEFYYEDKITGEQDWDKAKEITYVLEAQQLATRQAVMVHRKAGKN